jgi:DNA-binding protein HU-beta
MNRTEFVAETSVAINRTNASINRTLSGLLNTARLALSEGESVKIAEFGTLKVVYRKERAGIDPRTQEPITIEAHNAIVFIPSKSLRELVNEGA